MPYRAVAVVLFALLPACERVLGAPDYRLEFEPPPAPVQNDLMAFYAEGSDECAACLAGEGCAEAFDGCSNRAGCPEFSACLIEEPSPASEVQCVTELEPDGETRSLARDISRCFQRCFQACEGGRDFSCAGNYDWPPPPRGTITLSQTLMFVNDTPTAAPVAGASVSICPDRVDCPEPLQRGGRPAVTDDGGHYSVELDIAIQPAPVAGFLGYRHVQTERAFPHRLEKGIPILVDQDEPTSLLTREDTVLLAVLNGIDPASLNAVVFQVFDCRTVGATGVFVEAPDSPDAIVLYKEPSSYIGQKDTGTFASAEGSGVVTGLEVGRSHRLEARLDDGTLLGTADVIVPGGTVVMASIHPGPRRQ